MTELKRIEYALEYVTNASIITIDRAAWENLVYGEPTLIETVPVEMNGLLKVASLVSIAGSGIYNPSPGIDVVRYDPNDSPYIYNIYHYTVIENFSDSPFYQRAISVAGVKDSDTLQTAFRENVFIVGPYCLDNHWSVEIPEAIKNAKKKDK